MDESCIRALGLNDYCYDRLLDFLHSPALDIEELTQIWVRAVLRIFPKSLMVNGHLVLLGDGIKIAKEGRKMPAVKYFHQQSDSNSKAENIMGHSCQALPFSPTAANQVLDGMVALIKSITTSSEDRGLTSLRPDTIF